MKINILFIILFSSLSVFAYVPNQELILNRTVKNHGYGGYKVVQDVTIISDGEPLTVRENWIIRDGEQMRLDAQGVDGLSDFKLTYLYKKNQRYYLNENRIRKSQKELVTWFEPLFHLRTKSALKRFLVTRNILPSKALRNRSPLRTLKKIDHSSPDYLNLSRTNGVISFRFGLPQKAAAAVWIEQDQFVLRKLRFSNSTEIVADNYSSNSRGLFFPKTRSVKWDDFFVQIHLREISPLSIGPKTRAKLDPKRISKDSTFTPTKMETEQEALIQFYKKFR